MMLALGLVNLHQVRDVAPPDILALFVLANGAAFPFHSPVMQFGFVPMLKSMTDAAKDFEVVVVLVVQVKIVSVMNL